MRRLKTFAIYAPYVSSLMTTGKAVGFKVVDGLPADAKMIQAKYDVTDDTLYVTFESDFFPTLPYGIGSAVPLSTMKIGSLDQ